jgi:hypothetical protein
VYTKLRVWGLVRFATVVFLDADMVVLRDLSELFEVLPVSRCCFLACNGSPCLRRCGHGAPIGGDGGGGGGGDTAGGDGVRALLGAARPCVLRLRRDGAAPRAGGPAGACQLRVSVESVS